MSIFNYYAFDYNHYVPRGTYINTFTSVFHMEHDHIIQFNLIQNFSSTIYLMY